MARPTRLRPKTRVPAVRFVAAGTNRCDWCHETEPVFRIERPDRTLIALAGVRHMRDGANAYHPAMLEQAVASVAAFAETVRRTADLLQHPARQAARQAAALVDHLKCPRCGDLDGQHVDSCKLRRPVFRSQQLTLEDRDYLRRAGQLP